jgi:hypothetical protein
MNITYTLGQAPSGTERAEPAPTKKVRSAGEMDTSSSETSSDDENPRRRARYPPPVQIGHYLNPKTGRWCKTSGRVYNRMLNKGLGIDNVFPPIQKSEAPKTSKNRAVGPPPQPATSAPVDIWARYGF